MWKTSLPNPNSLFRSRSAFGFHLWECLQSLRKLAPVAKVKDHRLATGSGICYKMSENHQCKLYDSTVQQRNWHCLTELQNFYVWWWDVLVHTYNWEESSLCLLCNIQYGSSIPSFAECEIDCVPGQALHASPRSSPCSISCSWGCRTCRGLCPTRRSWRDASESGSNRWGAHWSSRRTSPLHTEKRKAEKKMWREFCAYVKRNPHPKAPSL